MNTLSKLVASALCVPLAVGLAPVASRAWADPGLVPGDAGGVPLGAQAQRAGEPCAEADHLWFMQQVDGTVATVKCAVCGEARTNQVSVAVRGEATASEVARDVSAALARLAGIRALDPYGKRVVVEVAGDTALYVDCDLSVAEISQPAGAEGRCSLSISGDSLHMLEAAGGGIRVQGDLAIDGGLVRAASDNGTALYAGGSLSVRGGRVDARGRDFGIAALGDVAVSGSPVVSAGCSSPLAYAAAVRSYGSLSMSGGELEASGTSLGLCAGEDVTVSGGTLRADATSRSGVAVFARGTVAVAEPAAVIAPAGAAVVEARAAAGEGGASVPGQAIGADGSAASSVSVEERAGGGPAEGGQPGGAPEGGGAGDAGGQSGSHEAPGAGGADSGAATGGSGGAASGGAGDGAASGGSQGSPGDADGSGGAAGGSSGSSSGESGSAGGADAAQQAGGGSDSAASGDGQGGAGGAADAGGSGQDAAGGTASGSPGDASGNAGSSSAGSAGSSGAGAVAEIAATSDEGNAAGATFRKLRARVWKAGKASLILKWTKMGAATEYLVFGTPCGAGEKYRYLGSTTGAKFKQAGLKKGRYYRFIVVAMKGGSQVLAKAATVHGATKGGKVTNIAKVSLPRARASMSVGEKLSVGAATTKVDEALKYRQHVGLRYESSNKKVATVRKGKVTAKGAGTCWVYAYAQNGVYARMKVTVA